ncbi:MAG: hypothetical protein M3Q29_25865 [Chloroflexota bacterium]|nr:hypothetical protein [Chloroflexota bacterium]
MDNTPTSKERFDQQVEEARENMLSGKDTPWLEREPHRGEQAYVEGGENIDPVSEGPGGGSGGASFGTSGAHQGSASSGTYYGGADGPRGGHVDTPGAFGEEGDPQVSTGTQSSKTMDTFEKLQDQ